MTVSYTDGLHLTPQSARAISRVLAEAVARAGWMGTKWVEAEASGPRTRVGRNFPLTPRVFTVCWSPHSRPDASIFLHRQQQLSGADPSAGLPAADGHMRRCSSYSSRPFPISGLAMIRRWWDMSLAVVLLAGLLMSVLCGGDRGAGVKDGNRPDGPVQAGQPCGVHPRQIRRFGGALALFTATLMVAVLLASRMAYDACGDTDVQSLLIYVAAVLGLSRWAVSPTSSLRRPFVSDAVFAFSIPTAVALVVVVNYTAFWTGRLTVRPRWIGGWFPRGSWCGLPCWCWPPWPLASSTRLDIIPTLAVCSALFLLGLMSDYPSVALRPGDPGGPRRPTPWFPTGSSSGRRMRWSRAGASHGGTSDRLPDTWRCTWWEPSVVLLLFEDRELG